jgi:hypothetical protein
MVLFRLYIYIIQYSKTCDERALTKESQDFLIGGFVLINNSGFLKKIDAFFKIVKLHVNLIIFHKRGGSSPSKTLPPKDKMVYKNTILPSFHHMIYCIFLGGLLI